MRILLTNDDSHDSPLFLLAIEILRDLGDLTVVVPATEQSWKGKSMTRFGELYVDRVEPHGASAWSVSGKMSSEHNRSRSIASRTTSSN